MHNTGTNPALGGSPARMVTAGASFCAAPDPLLDLRPSAMTPDLYSPSSTLCFSARSARATSDAVNCDDPAYFRSFRNHPSNFGKENL
ncbi:MAG: hypothetical protein PUK59_05515 [Actinomycetaceae bacterium]|nr:hypothetical protein [Actinomycetaceae bacterium]MDY5854685.1 hypothetical protein [Arcanobacterium sp.]